LIPVINSIFYEVGGGGAGGIWGGPMEKKMVLKGEPAKKIAYEFLFGFSLSGV